MINESRIQPLKKNHTVRGDYVLYWMQASQRAEHNHALEFAIEQANELKLPVIVYFGLTDAFPEANERHYYFMLEGLRDVKKALANKGIGIVIERCSPEVGTVKFGKRASLIVCDRGYLKIQKKWRQYVSEHIECPLIQVESDVIVPVEVASTKEEYSAATLRHKIQRVIPKYLVSLEEQIPCIDSTGFEFGSQDISDTYKAVAKLTIDRSVRHSLLYHGGTDEAEKRLREFILKKLAKY